MFRPCKEDHIQFVATPENVTLCRAVMREHLHRLGVNGELLDDIAIALTEAVANVVRHAYRNGDAGSFEVEVAILDKGIELSISDTGCGFLPHPESEGIGMGLPLMHRLADDLHIDGEPGDGTTVRMWFGSR